MQDWNSDTENTSSVESALSSFDYVGLATAYGRETVTDAIHVHQILKTSTPFPVWLADRLTVCNATLNQDYFLTGTAAPNCTPVCYVTRHLAQSLLTTDPSNAGRSFCRNLIEAGNDAATTDTSFLTPTVAISAWFDCS